MSRTPPFDPGELFVSVCLAIAGLSATVGIVVTIIIGAMP